MFGGKLPRINITVTDITIFDGPVYGAYVPGEPSVIMLDNRITTRGMLIRTLAHEMVHQYQEVLGFKVLTHGKFFNKYVAKFAKYGIDI
jgi:hypothetical protein